MIPLAIDLFAGLGGWTEGLLTEGYCVVGFDVERHRYPARAFTLPEDAGNGMSGKNKNGTTLINAAREQVHGYHTAPMTGGWIEYPAQLVLQDVLTIHGRQFKNAALIVASPPCQAYSYRAMPWKRAKALPPPDNTLFEACFRIQREAIEAAGHHIPLVVENVRGAQKWVGRSRWNFGSFHLFGDVPALMPMTIPRPKVGGLDWNRYGEPGYKGEAFNTPAERRMLEESGQKNPGFRFDGSGKSFQSESVNRHTKNSGGSWFNIGSSGQKETGQNPVHALAGEGVKQRGSGREWFAGDGKISRMTSSKSSARKAASAMIAKIPLVLSRHIAAVYHPSSC